MSCLAAACDPSALAAFCTGKVRRRQGSLGAAPAPAGGGRRGSRVGSGCALLCPARCEAGPAVKVCPPGAERPAASPPPDISQKIGSVNRTGTCVDSGGGGRAVGKKSRLAGQRGVPWPGAGTGKFPVRDLSQPSGKSGSAVSSPSLGALGLPLSGGKAGGSPGGTGGPQAGGSTGSSSAGRAECAWEPAAALQSCGLSPSPSIVTSIVLKMKYFNAYFLPLNSFYQNSLS